jgi:zinc protease
MLDRIVAPEINPPSFGGLTSPNKTTLSNGVECYFFNSGDQDVFKIELILSSGSAITDNPAIANTSVEMLREGTLAHRGNTLNEVLDYYGAFLDLKSGLDHSVITLYGRSTFLDTLIPLLSEILLTPQYDEQALTKQKDKAIQNLKINQAKTSYWAPRLLRKSLFGTNHGYSREIREASISGIHRDKLVRYHEDYLVPSLHSIIIAGSYEQAKMEALIDQGFSSIKIDEKAVLADKIDVPVQNQEKKIEGANQGSIALGKLTLNNRHSEYPGHALLIKLFGGYFGSRLMKTLREEEGLTYGIHAYTSHLKSGSYLQITSDIEHNSIDKGVDLIFAEMNKLTKDLVGPSELETVKNYMLGEMVNGSNNVFDFAELYKKIILQELPIDYYDSFYRDIANISSNDILVCAQQTLIPEEFSIVKVH